MRTVLLAALRSHLRRYVAVGVAVGIGVAFVVVTGAITSATRDGLSASVGAPFEGADVVATDVDPRRLDRVQELAADDGARLSVIGSAQLPVTPDDGVPDDLFVGAVPGLTDSPAWPEVVDGRLPAADGEAVVAARTAETLRLGPGDTITVGEGRRAAELTVVGTVEPGTSSGAEDVFLRWDDLEPFADLMFVEAVAWSGPGSLAVQSRTLGTVVGADRVQPARQYVDAKVVAANDGVDVLTTMLLLFAGIALFVAVLVIANTFAILLAQRRRELALLRCVGATRAQLQRSVRLEALAVGTVATALGMLAGAGLGRVVVAVVRDRFPETGLGDASASWSWYAAAAVVGVLVTVLAAWLPTRRATRVPPVAALGPDDSTRLATGAGRVRVVAGLVGVLGGTALLLRAVSLARANAADPALVGSPVPLLWMLAGGMAAFAGVVLLGPVLVPALVRLVGAAASRVAGPTARLAADNASRDPRRTGAATASLIVGVTLTTAVLVGIASTRSVIDAEMATQHPLDATVTRTAEALPEAAVDRLAAVPGVERAVAVPGAVARVGSGVGEVTVLAPDEIADLGGLALDPDVVGGLADDEIRLPASAYDGLRIDRRVSVTAGDRTLRLRPVYTEGDAGQAALVSPAVLARLAPRPATGAVWILAESGTSGADLTADLAGVAGSYDAGVTDGLARRDYVDLQLTIVTASVVGMLGIAVVIALVGIANTLGLSVLERTRELALLRALGLTRARLRGTLALEGVLLAVVATVLGTAVGVAFGWVGLQTVIAPVVAATPLVLPWGQLGLVVLAAALAGLLAAVLPARRAARVAPAAGLTAD
ncbi:FtsX-like permease family protein [Nocardioides sp. CFH 31398]|uniref:FtsX-like permease family protein n=1 Tax=Nocardioides sp. CFH 31398 TaxID=2919579 RepID=UPI001F057C31|nr:FtsX-like permease family protein [Nocardioides sp. CFH 31398]MCH1867799.1 FtsX-like permease family protein [Nocardioides sp. CFH 31398]